jgi:hypothetical protein
MKSTCAGTTTGSSAICSDTVTVRGILASARRLCGPAPMAAAALHGTHCPDHARRGLPSGTPRRGEAVTGAGRPCARIAVRALPHWCRATTCSYWTRRARCHIVATTLPFPDFFPRHVAHGSSPPTSGSPPRQGTGCVAPLGFHTSSILFSRHAKSLQSHW